MAGLLMERLSAATLLLLHGDNKVEDVRSKAKQSSSSFQMPLHYPKYKRADYEGMPEWKLDTLLASYGLPVTGTLENKREYAMGAFLWG